MRSNRLLRLPLLLLPLLLATLACQTVTRSLSLGFTATPTPTATVTRTVTALPTRTATLLPTGTPVPTATPHPPTSTPPPTQTVQPTSAIDQTAIFEEVWTAVRDNYLYPDFNGLDWDAIHEEYQAKIDAGMSDMAFYLAMDEMIARLGDDHSIFFSPQDAAVVDAQYEGDFKYVGIGVLTTSVPERNRVTIILVFPGSPAEQAGLAPHDSILAVDGKPILDENGFRRDILRGPEGSIADLTVQSPGEQPRQVEVSRRAITGNMPVPYQSLTSPKGKRIGYLMLPTFEDQTISSQVALALKKLSAGGKLDGLIIDNRENGGGADIVTEDVLRYFTKGLLGHFIDRKNVEPLRVIGENIGGSQNLPLVVLVGKDTASFGEIFSGILKDISRAYLIGETTDGNMEILWVYDFDDGSRAWIAHSTFRPLNHPKDNWEESGIIPDQTVVSNWDEFTLETDPAIKASLDHFDAHGSAQP